MKHAASHTSAETATQTAKESGLHYVSDAEAGIRRVRAGKKFRYLRDTGQIVRDSKTLNRIATLAIPPAWKNVWISTDPQGHLQATGRDARGRKQSIYHPRWRELRDQNKFARIPRLARCLKQIRRHTKQHLRLCGLPREKVLATVVQLLEMTQIRVGNNTYAEHNHSYGLTTLHNNHVKVKGAQLRFQFRGKSGVKHALNLQDHRLARIVKQCQDLPGQELFQYLDDEGRQHAIGSTDVNNYLRQISGEDFTAKDFRTWAGTLFLVEELQHCQPYQSEREAKQNVNKAIESVAKRLGNTKAVCRKCYIHPAVIEAYLGQRIPSVPEGSQKKTFGRARAAMEKIMLIVLRQQLRRKRT